MARTHRSTTSPRKTHARRGNSMSGRRERDSLDQSAQSGHVRALTEDGRLLPTVGLWSRSNTALSPTSSQPPSTPGSITDCSSRRNSQDDGSFNCLPQQDLSESVAKSLLHRGSRVLRRQGSKFSIASLIASETDQNADRDMEVVEICQRGHRRQSKSSTTKKEALKRTISAPYNFHHVTHTNRSQFENLDRVSKNELISEFCAIRAGQRSKTELKGIKAEDVQSAKHSLELLSLSQPDLRLSVVEIAPSTPSIAHQPRSPTKNSVASPASSKGLRLSRSIENFSRPSPRSPLSPLSPTTPRSFPRSPISPVTSPSRNSSRSVCASPGFAPEPNPSTLGSITAGNPPLLLFYTPPPGNSESLPAAGLKYEEPHLVAPLVGNAITTNDDSARQLRASPLPMLPTDLADVPEEDEGNFWTNSDGGISEPSTSRLLLRHAQTFPSSKTPPDSITPQPRSSDTPEPTTPKDMTKSWPTRERAPPMESPTKARHSAGYARRFSIGLKPINAGAWEEDIDYCYEHAAEADCDFEWDRKSSNGFPLAGSQSPRSLERVGTTREVEARENDYNNPVKELSFYHGSLRPPQLLPWDLLIPDLEPTSALSTSSLPSAVTPLNSDPLMKDIGAIQPWIEADRFEAKPRVYYPDDAVDQVISEYASDSIHKHLSYTNSVKVDEKCSASQDLMPQSRFQGSITMSIATSYAGSRASSNSFGSLPELVYSVSSRRIADSDSRGINRGSPLSHQSYPPASLPKNDPYRYSHGVAMDMTRPTTPSSGRTSIHSYPSTKPSSDLTLQSIPGRARSAPQSPAVRHSPPSPAVATPSPSPKTNEAQSHVEAGRITLSPKASYSLFPSTADPRLVWP